MKELRADSEADPSDVSRNSVGILKMLTLPALLVSMFGLMVTSSGWDWYQSSISTFLEQEYSLSASQIGLVLVSSGVTYIITSPICGYILGRTYVTLWVHHWSPGYLHWLRFVWTNSATETYCQCSINCSSFVFTGCGILNVLYWYEKPLIYLN